MKSDETLRFFMDESSAPYSENDAFFSKSEEDEIFDEMIIAKYGLTTKAMEEVSVE